MSSLTGNSRLALCVFLASLTSVFSQSQPRQAGQSSAVTSIGSLNINRLWLKVRNDGIIGYDSIKGTGLTYPFQYGGLLYADNLVWVGKVYDGQLPTTFMQLPELRTGGGTWQAGVQPGSIIRKGVAEDPGSEGVRVFRYRPGYLTADLTSDAAATNGIDIAAVTPAMIAALRTSYEKDEAQWPWQKGAPFYDRNRNGAMDAGETPGLQNASQVVWFSYNDLDENRSKLLAGGPSIGFEVQVTLWAYTGVPNLEDVIFKRYRVIYKGTAAAASNSSIDSLYFSQWIDASVGYPFDDLGGCDSTLSLGYQFSATNPDPVYKNIGDANPALGYAILQGPLVSGAPNDRGIADFERRNGKKNLPMTAFMLNPTGDPIGEPPYFSRWFWYWNVARGFSAVSFELRYQPYVLPSGQSTKYMYSGDPVLKIGWIDGLGQMYGGVASLLAGSRRSVMSTGPFTMALGDTQEVVIAMIASAAPTGIENVTWLRNRTKFVQAIYPDLGDYVAGLTTAITRESDVPEAFSLDQNYPNPFNPTTHIRFSIQHEGQVKLAIFDLLGRETRVVHQGVLSAGEHTLSWDGRDASGDPAPSGVYFYRLMQGDRQLTRKLLLVR